MPKKVSHNFDDKEIVRLYTEDGESIPSIATKFGTYHNMIRRILVRNKVEMRDKSQAQKLALSSKRTVHPTEGKPMSEATKIKISDKMGEVWDNKTPEELEKWKEDRRQQMLSMDKAEFEAQHKAALDAVRESSKYGSKLEQYLVKELRKLDYEVQLHTDHIVANERLRLDLFMPYNNMIIEVDGPSHREEIWGKDGLERQTKADLLKNGLLLVKGYNMLRIQQKSSLSLRVKRKALAIALKYLEEFKNEVGQLAQEEV